MNTLMILTCILALAAPPYLDFSKEGAGVYTDTGAWADPENLQSVRLGVLGPENSEQGREMRAAIQIALDEANAQGGYRLRAASAATHPGDPACLLSDRSIPYEMVFRADDGPWGVAASQVVRMIHEDKVWTIIGGLDGQSTHLAELVVAKTWVPVITPAAIDSTLDYANVPWVFRAMPADQQQAKILVRYAKEKGFQRLVLITEAERESYAAKRRLLESARHHQLFFFRQFEYQPDAPDEIVPRLRESDSDAILLWGRAESALSLIKALRQNGVRVPVLTSSLLAIPETEEAAPQLGELIVSAPYDLADPSGQLQSFRAKFHSRTGRQVGPVGVYSYDVTRLVLRAIENQGLHHTRIRNGLMAAGYNGLAGRYQFDSLGGNQIPPVLLTLQRTGWKRVDGVSNLAKPVARSRALWRLRFVTSEKAADSKNESALRNSSAT
jgi:branched-chain amino acid transport system substrate-binding protein